MQKGNLSRFFRRCISEIRECGPEILTGLGISGSLYSIVQAVKATPRAVEAIQNAKNERKRKLSKKEIFLAAWRYYVPCGVTYIMSSTCIIFAGAIHAKRNTMLTTAYSLSESALRLYQEKVVETIGEKKEQEIRDKVAKEKIEKNPVKNQEIIVTSAGNTLCYDAFSSRYFKSDIETLRRAVNELNRRMIHDMCLSLNDFYDEIGLAGTKFGDQIGWNVNSAAIELVFSSQLAENGTPCLVIDFRTPPNYHYE